MNFIRKSIYLMLGLGGLFSFQSCSDWNEISPKTPDYTELKDVNPEQYKKYLANLREYRKTDHKVMYTWFDISEKNVTLKPQHINNVPDSVDVIILKNSDYLVERELKEIKDVREKGMEVLYFVDFDGIKSDYADYLKEIEESTEEEANTIEVIQREDFILDKLKNNFQVINKYNFDGICLSYVGKGSMHMKEDEKRQYTNDEILFMTFFKAWESLNPEKTVVFAGSPQNLLDKYILTKSKNIIIYTQKATNEANVAYAVSIAAGEGIPTDRYVVTAQLPSRDPNEPKIGFWSDKSNAVVSTAIWATGNFSYTVSGMALMDIENDYYSKSRIYAHSREAISILNPSLK